MRRAGACKNCWASYFVAADARVESFAFVLYYRLRRTSEAEAVLHKYHTVSDFWYSRVFAFALTASAGAG